MSSRAGGWFLLVLLVGLGVVLFSGSRWAIRPANPLLPIVMPVQRGLVQAADGPRAFLEGLTRGWRLESENRVLREELLRLTGEIARLRQAESDNENLRALLQFQRANPQWQYIGANVVAFDGQRLAQTMVIDAGGEQGIDTGLVVVVAGGLVGRVVDVGPRAARVLLLSDPRSAVNVQIQGSATSGIVRALVGGEFILDFVERDAGVHEGELVVTSGLRAALVGGLALDVLGSQPLGLTVVTLLAGAYLAGWLREQLAEPVLAVSVLAVICGSFFADLVQAAYLAGSGGFLSWRALLLRAVLPAAASNGLVSVALLPVLHGFAEGGEREPGGFLRRTLPGRLWR